MMAAVLLMSSCKVLRQSATADRPFHSVNTVTVADLIVSDTKIVYTYEPSKAVRRGGDANVLNTAIREALRKNGNGDVLVAMEYITLNTSSSFFGSGIKKITVSGYPATYTNFHSLGDSIWNKADLFDANAPKQVVKVNCRK